jgi:hypothetical protein
MQKLYLRAVRADKAETIGRVDGQVEGGHLWTLADTVCKRHLTEISRNGKKIKIKRQTSEMLVMTRVFMCVSFFSTLPKLMFFCAMTIIDLQIFAVTCRIVNGK